MHHQYGISATESQTFLLVKWMFLQAIFLLDHDKLSINVYWFNNNKNI